MQYQVPQFIETEDTIVGSLTIKQFAYIFIAGGISFILYFFLTGFLWLTVTFLVIGFALALGFMKYNGRPLSSMLFSFFLYFWRPRLYVWQRKEELEALRAAEAEKRGSALQNLWLRITAGNTAIPQRESRVPEPVIGYQRFRKDTGDTGQARRVDYR
jgi:hypothetical protein